MFIKSLIMRHPGADIRHAMLDLDQHSRGSAVVECTTATHHQWEIQGSST
jgi:hypothetical protein